MTTNIEEFKRKCEEATVNERKRFEPLFSHRHDFDVHPYVFTAVQSLIDLIGYCSDSTLDEFQNEILCVVSQDDAEEILSCGYATTVCDDPKTAEYRAFCTEVDSYAAIRNHMTPEELDLIEHMAVNVFDAHDTDPDVVDADAVMRHEFNVAATWIEQRRIK